MPYSYGVYKKLKELLCAEKEDILLFCIEYRTHSQRWIIVKVFAKRFGTFMLERLSRPLMCQTQIDKYILIN